MWNTIGPLAKLKPAQIAFLAAGAVTAALATRYLSVRKINAAERLAEALLATESLQDAAHKMTEASEATLAACATYMIGVAFHAAEGHGLAGGLEDPVGFSRTHRHPYSHAVTTVLTESNAPEHLLTYAVMIPDVGEVRGTRRIGGLRMTGLSPARPAPDTAQITLSEGYTAQLESEFEIADYLVAGSTRLFGAATLRDNRGNVGRVHVGYDGAVSGTITREGRVIGRFEGKVATGVKFRQYLLEAGDAKEDAADGAAEPDDQNEA